MLPSRWTIHLLPHNLQTRLPYFLEKTPGLLFISSRELVQRLIEGGYYLRAAFIFSPRNDPPLNAALVVVPHLLNDTRTFIANVS